MDVNDLRAIVTVAGLGLFLVLVARTWSRRAKAAHDEAARLPFLGDTQGETQSEGERL
jgi:cbb3-type cytochrome oxidase subunit 3